MSMMTPRPYHGIEDLNRILPAVGEWYHRSDASGYYHPGFIRHFLSSTTSGRNPARYLHLVEEAGVIQSIVMFNPYPPHGYDLLVHPALRASELESEMIAWSEQQLLTVMTEDGIILDTIITDVLDCDTIRSQLLTARGYETTGNPWLLEDRRSLLDPIPDPALPEGFTIRGVTGEHEEEAVRLVHNGGFNVNWQPGEYLDVMRAPGFEIDHELVAVAPDGQFASFLIYWIDPISRVGLFEPVACRPEFRRRGLTKALLLEGMRRMKAEGALTAVLKHDIPSENPASCALYASVGFTSEYGLLEYRKKLP